MLYITENVKDFTLKDQSGISKSKIEDQSARKGKLK
jgi:hypothetical protein